MADPAQMTDELAAIVGQDFVKTDPTETTQFSIDGIVPKAVVYPKNTRQVSEVVKYANSKNLAIVPWGGGSKITMGHPPTRLDLVVCTRRMNHMKDVDVSNLTVTVEAGVKFLDIQARLATEDDRCYLPLEDLITDGNEMICSDRSHSGCFLPIDPPCPTRATIGGIIAADSSGPRRLLYTLPRDLILGIRFVAADGEIIGSGGKTVKNVSGYDISKLMVGSAGSLGILCEMTLRLLPLPEAMETLLFSFDAFADASGFIDRIFDTQLLPAAVEIMNRNAFGKIMRGAVSGFQAGAFVVPVALEAFQEAVDRMRNEMKKMAAESNATAEAVLPETEHRPFWLAVGDLNPSVAENHPGRITARLNYPVAAWKEIIEYAEAALEEGGIDHTLLAHAGSGVCLINLMITGNGDRDQAADAVSKLLKRCLKSHGNLVIEQAPVEMKQKLPIWGEAGSDLVVMKRIKQTLDPRNVMSPGRYVAGL
jgi:glycolate oxidase FAD binding subunit